MKENAVSMECPVCGKMVHWYRSGRITKLCKHLDATGKKCAGSSMPTWQAKSGNK